MNELALRKQIDSLDKQLKLAGEYHKKEIIDLRGEIDHLKLEIAALQKYLESAFPDFGGRFPEIVEQTIREVNPEFK